MERNTSDTISRIIRELGLKDKDNRAMVDKWVKDSMAALDARERFSKAKTIVSGAAKPNSYREAEYDASEVGRFMRKALYLEDNAIRSTISLNKLAYQEGYGYLFPTDNGLWISLTEQKHNPALITKRAIGRQMLLNEVEMYVRGGISLQAAEDLTDAEIEKYSKR